MQKNPLFCSVQPDDSIYTSSIRIQLHNFRKYGYSSNYHVLFFVPHSRLSLGPNPEIKNLIKDFPETKFFVYEDFRNVERIGQTFDYIPVIRPWTLHEHWKKHSELCEEQIFYLDNDVIFTKYLDFSVFDNKKAYLSSTPYINLAHFTSKMENVREDRMEQFKSADIAEKIANICGITKEIVEKNDKTTGGAQYLLYGVDGNFWNAVMNNCLSIRDTLKRFNQSMFKGDTPGDKESNGIQSWCADMWAVLYNLWKRGVQTETPWELDFAWNTDPISKWNECYIYHDAGSTSEYNILDGEKLKTFNKKKYSYQHIWNHPELRTPFQDKDELEQVSPKLASLMYAKEVLETAEFFKL